MLLLLFILLLSNTLFIREGFQDTDTTVSIPPSELTEVEDLEINTKDIQYISCVAFERFDEKNKEKSGTTELLKQAPCWSYFSKTETFTELINDFRKNIKITADKNRNTLKGPCYMIIGRNKNEKKVEGWVYLASVRKNGINTETAEEFRPYHIWIRKLLFSNTFAVDHWLCYNSCNDDLKLTDEQKASIKFTGRSPTFTPGCGCVSNQSCSYYYIPSDISIAPRKKENVSSYSIYTFLPEFFTNVSITLEEPTQLEMDRLPSGSTLFEGCDSKIVSKNRLHAFQIEPNGFAFYDANPSMPFTDTCIQKPNEFTFYDKSKVLKNRYDTSGKTPRLVNEDEDAGIYSIDTSKITNKKILEKQWNIQTSGNSPYELLLDDNGSLKIIDSKGVAQDVKFTKNQ